MVETKQIFKGKIVSRTKIKNNILRIYKMTDKEERHDWYEDANMFASSIGEDLSKVCGVIAALSPRKSWNMNKAATKEFFATGDCGHLKILKKKARDIMASDGTDQTILEILNGLKISSFYVNIRYPEKVGTVTIDRHALSVALGFWTTDDDYKSITKKQYQFFVQCYTIAAMAEGITPQLMQSATWTKWRKIKQNYKRSN